MPSTSRAVFVAGALLASTSLAQAGDKAAFTELSQDARVDLTPIVKAAPEAPATNPAPVVAGKKAADKGRAAPRPTKLARRAAKVVAVAALKATFPTASAPSSTHADAPPPATGSQEAVATAADGSPKAADAPQGQTEAAAPLPPAAPTPGGPREAPSGTVSELLEKHALANGVPLKLAKAVVTIESRGNARASHAGALGLMQIKYGTARAAGFSGPAVGLFAADTNLRFGMKILGDAYRAAGGDTCGALMRYQSGHLATHMNSANRAYCSRARAIMAGA